MHQKGGAIQKASATRDIPKSKKRITLRQSGGETNITPDSQVGTTEARRVTRKKIKGETRFRNNVGIAITKVRMNQPNRVHQCRYKTTYGRIGKYT